MSIASLDDLRTQIASWLNRTTLTTAELNQFVAAAEDDIRNDLECRESEQRTTATLVDDGFIAPAGYMETRSLLVGGKQALYLAPEQYAAKVFEHSTAYYYTLNGDNFSVLNGSGADIELLYLSTIASLVADADTNWVLDNAGSVYLWAGCKYGAVFLRDPEAAAAYGTLYEVAMGKLNRKERMAKWGGPLQVRAA